MRKISILLIAILMSISLCACNDVSEDIPPAQPEEQAIDHIEIIADYEPLPEEDNSISWDYIDDINLYIDMINMKVDMTLAEAEKERQKAEELLAEAQKQIDEANQLIEETDKLIEETDKLLEYYHTTYGF